MACGLIAAQAWRPLHSRRRETPGGPEERRDRRGEPPRGGEVRGLDRLGGPSPRTARSRRARPPPLALRRSERRTARCPHLSWPARNRGA